MSVLIAPVALHEALTSSQMLDTAVNFPNSAGVAGLFFYRLARLITLHPSQLSCLWPSAEVHKPRLEQIALNMRLNSR